jgi:hypothetical protein
MPIVQRVPSINENTRPCMTAGRPFKDMSEGGMNLCFPHLKEMPSLQFCNLFYLFCGKKINKILINFVLKWGFMGHEINCSISCSILTEIRAPAK